ncbi:MAG: rhodanese-related sulfurtransferase [Verrucomicrobia bacterium]|nr:rhodanese-related sulfurtransferase [Verrucomicrobiota bacterium]MBS0637555.1 rhodanese-related sulfurtransferase [Verrucomicrobiota bacterium]
MFNTWIVQRSSLLEFDNKLPYLVLAYYHITKLEQPELLVKAHKAFFKDKDFKGRIYLAKDGINGTLSAPKELVCEYMQWLWSQPGFDNAEFKIQEFEDHTFGKLTVKTRPELVALGFEVPLDEKAIGAHLSPKEWREMYETEENKVVLDVRNDYEWELGHFEGSESPPCKTFKDFDDYSKELKARVNPETKVLMCCTGGIRCEFFSSLLKQQGFEHVFQLQGGIIKYGAEEKSKHWKGKLFVFDDRLSIPISDEKTEVIGKCHHCNKEAERYYNCANMDCNELFLCCEDCLKAFHGCCQDSCQKGTRVRPYKLACTPFRKWYTYAKSKEELNTLRAT